MNFLRLPNGRYVRYDGYNRPHWQVDDNVPPVSYTHLASVKLITDRETRRSKGFAFVEMPNDGEAKEAIKQLNGAECVNRTMLVKEALPKA